MIPRLKFQIIYKLDTSVFLIGFIIGIFIAFILFNSNNSVPAENIQSKNSFKTGTELNEILFNKIRILCFIITYKNNHATLANDIKRTWGKHCNKILFISEDEDTELPTIKVNVSSNGRSSLWSKTIEAFKFIHKNYQDEYDWVFKADDDTFAIIENLRLLLMSHSCNDALFFGCLLQPVVLKYMSGGAGYVLSKEAVNRFITQGIYQQHRKCPVESLSGNEDVNLGACLQALEVKFGDSRDSKGRHRFFPESIAAYVQFNSNKANKWIKGYSYWNFISGENGWSKTPISFHRVNSSMMYKLYYLIYNLKSVISVKYLQKRIHSKTHLLLKMRKQIVNEYGSDVALL